MKINLLAHLVIPCATVSAFVPSAGRLPIHTTTSCHAQRQPDTSHDNNDETSSDFTVHRRDWMVRSITQSLALVTAPWAMSTTPASALVKGVAPPPPRNKGAGDKPKCTNVEECQAQAEERQQAEAEAAAANAEPAKTTAGGTRYRDETIGSGRIAKDGDEVTLLYKVLKLGKRSYDGLSGEGTVVFSRGYGFEDDEKVPGDKSFITTLGSPLNIAALNEAIAGMQPGGVRRFSVFPTKGWRKPGAACDGGPGGSGAGGELRTDYGESSCCCFVQSVCVCG